MDRLETWILERVKWGLSDPEDIIQGLVSAKGCSHADANEALLRLHVKGQVRYDDRWKVVCP